MHSPLFFVHQLLGPNAAALSRYLAACTSARAWFGVRDLEERAW